MQLSTKSRYGLRALLDIALHANEGPVLLREIVERQRLSKSYLEQLILLLQSGGFVRSIRGKKGGFVLAKSPSDIRLLDVIGVLERTLCLAECVDNPDLCPRNRDCVTQRLWGRLTDMVRNELASLTLQDLIYWQKGTA